MENFKTECTHRKDDYMEVDYIRGEFGFDILDHKGVNVGVIISRKEALRLARFLMEKLDDE